MKRKQISIFTCEYCGTEFFTEEACEEHEKEHTKENEDKPLKGIRLPYYIPTDKEAVEAALILQRYCEVNLEKQCRKCIHNLGQVGCCGICDEYPAGYIIPERIERETGAKLEWTSQAKSIP